MRTGVQTSDYFWAVLDGATSPTHSWRPTWPPRNSAFGATLPPSRTGGLAHGAVSRFNRGSDDAGHGMAGPLHRCRVHGRFACGIAARPRAKNLDRPRGPQWGPQPGRTPPRCRSCPVVTMVADELKHRAGLAAQGRRRGEHETAGTLVHECSTRCRTSMRSICRATCSRPGQACSTSTARSRAAEDAARGKVTMSGRTPRPPTSNRHGRTLRRYSSSHDPHLAGVVGTGKRLQGCQQLMGLRSQIARGIAEGTLRFEQAGNRHEITSWCGGDR